MRLRHKKPINSYAGQANHDSNDFRDEDFNKNYYSSKKFKIARERPASQPTTKLAEILCLFVNTINEDYRKNLKKNQELSPETQQKGDKSLDIRSVPFSIKEEINFKKTKEVVFKQQYKNQGVKNNINKLLSTKKIRKDKIKTTCSNEKKKADEKPAVLQQTVRKQKNRVINREQKQNEAKQKPVQGLANNFSHQTVNLQGAGMQNFQKLKQLQQMQQQLFQNPLYSINPALYSLLPFSLPQMVGYQMMMEQNKFNPMNPLLLNNFMGIPPSCIPPNCIPFSKLPFPRAAENFPISSKQEQKNSEPAKKEQQHIKQIQSPVKKTETIVKNARSNELIGFKSKSCTHVAIAYDIHFAKLKEKGLFNGMTDQKELQKLDPTMPARRIRQNKVADKIENANENTAINH